MKTVENYESIFEEHTVNLLEYLETNQLLRIVFLTISQSFSARFVGL